MTIGNTSPAKSPETKDGKDVKDDEDKDADDDVEDEDYSPPDDDDDDEIVGGGGKRKRARIMVIESNSDNSDRENESYNSHVEAKAAKGKKKKTMGQSSLESPVAKKKHKTDSKQSFEEKLATLIEESAGSKTNLKTKDKEPELDGVATVWLHNKIEFLRPENIRDEKKRKRDHPDYDCGTLFVPDAYLNTLTPVRHLLYCTLIITVNIQINFTNYS